MTYNVSQCPNCSSTDNNRSVYQCTNCKFEGCWDKWGGGCWPKHEACSQCGSKSYTKVADIQR
jgi:hypothetical protein